MHFAGSYNRIKLGLNVDISHGKMRFHIVSYWIGRTNCKTVGMTGQLSHRLLRLLFLQSGRYLHMFLQNLFRLRLSLQMDVLSFSEMSVNFCLTARASDRHYDTLLHGRLHGIHQFLPFEAFRWNNCGLLYGRGTSSASPKPGHRLGMCENRVLSKLHASNTK